LSIAGPTHREAATIGGNLCLDTRCLYYNQSHWWRKSNQFCLKYKGEVCHVAPTKKLCRAAYSGDLAPALMVHRAEVEIAGPSGARHIALDALYREDGADHLMLDHDEIIVGIYLPSTQARSGYRKVRVRGSIDFPLAGVAIACENTGSASHRFNVAVTGTNSCPVLVDIEGTLGAADDAEAFFQALAKKVQKRVTPLRTTTIAANYRRLSIAAKAEDLARELWNG
jgi:4-hydroxybenzoyl-CoA reductase subunit beta